MIKFYEKISNAVSDYNMISDGDAVVIALSGGADSVSLLYAMNKLSQQLGFSLSACHVNHGLRGEDSDSDMHFCEELCNTLSIPIEVLDTDVRSFQQKHESLEETARRIRYDFFEKVSQGKKLATAHNSNDSAETVLLNMMRGTGLKGLCGIPPVRGNIIRPLIYCSRDEVEQFCKENSLSYVTDKTNLSDDYTRNKVRHLILPEMLKINPSLLDTISRMEHNLREDNELIEALADKALQSAKSNRGYNTAVLSQQPKPILRRAIKRILMDGHIEPSTLRIEMAEEIILSGKGKINPCRGKFVTVKKGEVFIEEQEQIYKKHLNK